MAADSALATPPESRVNSNQGPRESFASSLAFGLDATLSVVVCYFVLGAFCVLHVALNACSRFVSAITTGALSKLSTVRATGAAALSSLGLIWIVGAWSGLDRVNGAATYPGLVVISLFFVAALYCATPAALSVPPTLDEIRQQTASRAFQRWVATRMGNQLDAVWIGPLVAVLIISVPAWLALVLPGTVTLVTLLWYATAILLCSETVATFEHANGHYRFFRSKQLAKRTDRVALGTLRILVEYLLDIALSRIPRWYGVEHVLVHHVEDNGPADLQSTEPFDRASFIDFARCANRFALSGMFPIDVVLYLKRQKRWGGLRQLSLGLAAYYGTLALIASWNWNAVFVLLSLRYANLVRGSLTFFQEHGLIDPTNPGNIYRNSLHYINDGNSHASLGEDPHIEHHLHPGKHWSNYVAGVEHDLQRYAREMAVGFIDGPGRVRRYYQLMWVRNFRELAKMFVVYGINGDKTDEVAHLLEERTRPVSGVARSNTWQSADILLGRGAGRLLI